MTRPEHITALDAVAAVLKMDAAQGQPEQIRNETVAPLTEPTDLNFSIDTAMTSGPTNRMANATWRILEEQRVNALEIVAECDEAIAKLLAKRDDALKAAAMCAAGQKGVS